MKDLLARKNFHEMYELEKLIQDFGEFARVRSAGEVSYKDRSYPLYVLNVGSQNPEHPVLALFGGVHGLEKIGAEVVISYMHTVLELLRWDKSFHKRLETTRLLFMPIVNPIGIVLRSRSNGNGVDLMRNSPIEAPQKGGPIYRGHRISPRLPWYRGLEGAPMEPEAKALCEVVKTDLFPAKLAVAVDIHSGFGSIDRFWFPYAHTRDPFPFVGEVYALKELYDHTYPHHFYAIEPVSRQYTIHGDLWDYMFKESLNLSGGKPKFFPWTLEMGSWMWLRKNPAQIFSPFGVFHPIKPHRRQRILRRHLTLFDFLHRSLDAAPSWADLPSEVKEQKKQLGLRLWYE